MHKFSNEEKEAIKLAIQKAEYNTSGEIRVVVEDKCREDVLDRAAYQFKKLAMHKTALRNGVLIYLSITDKKFAIIGDAGINAVTGPDFWNEAKEQMLAHFRENQLVEGLTSGITLVGQAMKTHFPYTKDDKNELSDDIIMN